MFQRYAALRALIYFGAVAVFYAVSAQLAKEQGGFLVFLEGGFAETVQLGCIVVTALLLVFLARAFPEVRGILALLAAVSALAAIRELNNTDTYRVIFFFPGASWVFGLVALGLVGWKFGKDLPQQVRTMMNYPACTIFVAGFTIIVAWTQIFAQRTIFNSAEVDRIVEEGLETAGYLLILSGVIELSCNLRRNQSGKQS